MNNYISSEDETTNAANETSVKYYTIGVEKGIIDPDKYPFTSFLRDEENVFKRAHEEYVALNRTEVSNYGDWLILNNYGILPDTQESLFDRKLVKRSTADNKRKFVNTVRKGDILITGRGIGGLIGHAAIMTTNNWVLEMKGGPGWLTGIEDNNRQVLKHKWFDEHASDWTSVYRCPNKAVADAAAVWADHNYYNPSAGAKKLKHVKYFLTPNVWSLNPSYCSKLVIQAYYYGTGKRKVIRNISKNEGLIVPINIPTYFLNPYKLKFKGKY
ncbi:Uncharacterized 30.3 kDa protein [Eumeta japonica]|uniref:Uncharacterized 30.3 kDa protein n=1 Tax=Eumeta variegata TaxID=151549 RepID=A0A4C1T112_EUMVA|nr:Uncharacterized 30.3 kDa protein [Eumeta japonica]